MADPTLKFVIFTLFNLASLVAGYVARRSGLLNERHSRPLHFLTVALVWPTVSALSIWSMQRSLSSLWILVVIPLLMAIGAAVAIPLARAIGCDRHQVGVMAIAAAIGNLGFTCGSYLCYCVLDRPVPAFAYGVAIVTVMQIAAVPILYPIARHFGEADSDESTLKLIVRSFLDLRAMPLYAALLGLALNLLRVPGADVLWETWLIDPILLYLGAFTAVFGIGMKLRPGDWRHYLRQHALLAALKFGLFPVMTLVILAVIIRTPAPMDPLLAKVLWIEAFMPTGLMTVMIANLFHLDARLAAVAWLVNTIAFILVPLPVLLVVYG